jgi:hypothetical protein
VPAAIGHGEIHRHADRSRVLASTVEYRDCGVQADGRRFSLHDCRDETGDAGMLIPVIGERFTAGPWRNIT